MCGVGKSQRLPKATKVYSVYIKFRLKSLNIQKHTHRSYILLLANDIWLVTLFYQYHIYEKIYGYRYLINNY